MMNLYARNTFRIPAERTEEDERKRTMPQEGPGFPLPALNVTQDGLQRKSVLPGRSRTIPELYSGNNY
jgi:hypothetical protein